MKDTILRISTKVTKSIHEHRVKCKETERRMLLLKYNNRSRILKTIRVMQHDSR